MAANRGWIDETTRVLLAFVGSTALLVGGLYLHERQGRTQAALAAVATAIAALYLTLTAATQLYDLIDPVLALVFAALVGAVATAIAVRWDEQVVAGIGIVGALLAPVLVDAGTDSASLAFMAVALAAAVGVLLWRRTRTGGGPYPVDALVQRGPVGGVVGGDRRPLANGDDRDLVLLSALVGVRQRVDERRQCLPHVRDERARRPGWCRRARRSASARWPARRAALHGRRCLRGQ